MKVLVTGANGYLGQGVIKQLLDDRCEVVATDFFTKNVDPRATRVECDLFEIEDPFTYFGCPDVLLHMAWRDGFIHNSTSHILDFPKHYLFLEKMVNAGVSQVAVMGSMHEIGFYEGSIDEKTPCHPQSLYGVSKNALRECLQLMTAAKGTCFQWLRGYYIVGNSKFGNSIFSKITSAANAGQTHFPFTTGQNQFDFVDYDVFCLQVASVVQQKKVDGIINIGSGKPEKLGDRVVRFIQEQGYDIQLDYGVFPDRPYESKAVWGNGSKIEAVMKARQAN